MSFTSCLVHWASLSQPVGTAAALWSLYALVFHHSTLWFVCQCATMDRNGKQTRMINYERSEGESAGRTGLNPPCPGLHSRWQSSRWIGHIQDKQRQDNKARSSECKKSFWTKQTSSGEQVRTSWQSDRQSGREQHTRHKAPKRRDQDESQTRGANTQTHLHHEVAVVFGRHHDNRVVQLLVKVNVRRRPGAGRRLFGETHASRLGAAWGGAEVGGGSARWTNVAAQHSATVGGTMEGITEHLA